MPFATLFTGTRINQINQSIHIVLASGESGNHTLCKQEKMRKFLQIWKQVVQRGCQADRDVFGLLVPSCCYRLVTGLMTATGLSQVVPTRLIQAVRNRFVVINLLTTCWNNYCYKMIATCFKFVNNWEQAVRTYLVTSKCVMCNKRNHHKVIFVLSYISIKLYFMFVMLL